jgi:hypothetical protein
MLIGAFVLVAKSMHLCPLTNFARNNSSIRGYKNLKKTIREFVAIPHFISSHFYYSTTSI